MRKFLIVVFIAMANPFGTFLVICGTVALCQYLFLPTVDPLDEIGPQMYYTTTTHDVRDTLGNYFHITYNSNRPVSEPRATEIGLRDNVFAAKDSLQAASYRLFPDFTKIDIYDFAKLAREYNNEPDHHIERIRGDGNLFWELYKRPNYDLCMIDGGDTIVDCSNRGMPYILNEDIVGYFEKGEPKKYRYFSALYPWYEKDEKKTHCNMLSKY